MRDPERDQYERDRLEELLHSEGWKLVGERFQQMLKQKLARLCLDIPDEETRTMRGFIQGVQACLEVPKILLMERKPA